jgi:hypothetical protein
MQAHVVVCILEFFETRSHHVTPFALNLLSDWPGTHRALLASAFFRERERAGIKGMCHHTWPVFLLLFLKTLNATTIEGKAVLLFLPHREEATAEKLRTGLGECRSDLRGQHKA